MSEHMPDWQPKRSATDLPEAVLMFGSTGQLWQVRGGQWVRVTWEGEEFARHRAHNTDMLEALRALTKWVEAHEGDSSRVHAELQQARAAIAKATA